MIFFHLIFEFQQFDLENFSITFYGDRKILKNHNKVIQLMLMIHLSRGTGYVSWNIIQGN